MPGELGALFAAEGALAVALPGYSRREGQLEMAADVAALLAEGGVLACEAGTGTGKTLAYLAPLLTGGRRAMVSTGTRNLQDQLFFRDLPLVREALGARAAVALLKGRANYLCLHRLHVYSEQGRFGDRRVPAHLARIRAWAARTGSGDIAELAEVPETSPAWRFATSTRDNCLGSACAFHDECHLFEARRRAGQADLVVVNHHLLLAQLALAEEGGDLLPASAALVVDEAHQLADLATEFFGESLSSGQLLELSRDCDAARRVEAADMPALSHAAEQLERATRDLILALEGQRGRVALGALAGPSFDPAVAAVEESLAALAGAFSLAADRGRALASCEQRATALQARLALLCQEDEEGALSWLDPHGRGFTWRRSPLDVGPLLGPALSARHRAIVFTSATLAVAGDLQHFCTRVGLSDSARAIYPSPFDYAGQALLYLPPDMPDPRSPDYAFALHQCVRELLQVALGGVFVLFTSHAALRRARDALEGTDGRRLLVQGDAPRGQLIDEFRAQGDAVLLGTYSFWEGVDVRGPALSCVIIDKLPFAPPGDPLLAARHQALRKAGEDPFQAQQVPQAAIALKQGVGRLIRDADDRGVVAICDPRLRQRGYGRRLLASLPPMPRTDSIADVAAFFGELERAGYTAPGPVGEP